MGLSVSARLRSLELWRHALVSSVRGEAPDLSARQMALMLSVYLGDGPHTVRGLALALRISKPAVSRALDRLGEFGRRPPPMRRSGSPQRAGAENLQRREFPDRIFPSIEQAGLHCANLPDQTVEFVVEVENAVATVLSPKRL